MIVRTPKMHQMKRFFWDSFLDFRREKRDFKLDFPDSNADIGQSSGLGHHGLIVVDRDC